MNIIDIGPENVLKETFFCIKNTKDPGFKAKYDWFIDRKKEGLKLKILKSDADKPIAFIEYIPGKYAWRPVDAEPYVFIHCMYTYSNKDKGKGYASQLVKHCEDEAHQEGMKGVAVITSKGSWITDKRVFEKLGYEEVDQKGRFELMCKKFDQNAPNPKLIDWESKLKQYDGWHLLYSDQCPWHGKSVQAIFDAAKENDVDISIQKITDSKEAQNMPSGFAVFNLIHNGKLLADHYISATRFKNILKKELK